MTPKIKLSAGGPQYVSELLRYRCPQCKKDFLIHPTRWKVHLVECLKDLSLTQLSHLRESEENKVTKEFIECSMLHFHSLTKQ